MSVKIRALSAAEVQELPAMPSAQDAFAALGISEDLGYQLIRDGEFPIEVVKFGTRALRVRRSALLDFLGLAEDDKGGAGPAQSDAA